jgi:gamma-glutamylcyclotransferase (GGCT)/AIG2-like uncharacterized protein YtfP
MLYFAYGTTRAGFVHHARLGLPAPVARGRTAAAHAVVVPHECACSNPGCEYLHRMAVLVGGFAPLRVHGDLFDLGDDALAAIDALERLGPYVRAEIEVEADGRRVTALAYPAREPARWRALVARGGAEALAAYPARSAPDRPKPCCERDPGHPPPHDVVDPLIFAA